MNVTLRIDGNVLRLYTSVAFMLVHWSFKNKRAKAHLAVVDLATRDQLLQDLQGRWSKLASPFRELSRTAFVSSMQRQEVEIRLERGLAGALAAGLAACKLEFEPGNGWTDFCMAAPGAVADYSLRWTDLTAAREVLLRALEPG